MSVFDFSWAFFFFLYVNANTESNLIIQVNLGQARFSNSICNVPQGQALQVSVVVEVKSNNPPADVQTPVSVSGFCDHVSDGGYASFLAMTDPVYVPLNVSSAYYVHVTVRMIFSTQNIVTPPSQSTTIGLLASTQYAISTYVFDVDFQDSNESLVAATAAIVNAQQPNADSVLEIAFMTYCGKNFFSYNCAKHCDPPSQSEYYQCDSKGTKVCLNNFYSANDSSLHCTAYCVDSDSYSCDSDGSRICKSGYEGESCCPETMETYYHTALIITISIGIVCIVFLGGLIAYTVRRAKLARKNYDSLIEMRETYECYLKDKARGRSTREPTFFSMPIGLRNHLVAPLPPSTAPPSQYTDGYLDLSAPTDHEDQLETLEAYEEVNSDPVKF